MGLKLVGEADCCGQLSLPLVLVDTGFRLGWPGGSRIDESAGSGSFRFRQHNNHHTADSLQNVTQQSPPPQELRLPFRHHDGKRRQGSHYRQNRP